MRSGGGDKERAPSVLQQGVQAKGSEQTNCCQSVGRRRGKQKKAHARTKDLRVSARLCDSVFALIVYMRIHLKKKKEEGQSFQMLILRRRLLV